MELKWLEDFVSLARNRNFSRAAEERHVTQPAFSRRIQALELWLGVSLINRSTYPTTLTDEGQRFLETAEETIRQLHASRVELRSNHQPSSRMVSIAALHTLALAFFPRWFRLIEERAGPLSSRLLPEDFHGCVQAIVEGGYDFLLTFHHPNVHIPLEPELYPHMIVGTDSFVAVRAPTPDTAAEGAGAPPLLAYSPHSFLGRVASFAQAQVGAPSARIVHTNENAIAEALKFMALEGHGLAWLPRSLVAREIDDARLVPVGPEIPLEVRLYRNARRTRAIVDSLWSAAADLCS